MAAGEFQKKDEGLGRGGLVLVHSCWPTCNAISAAGQSPSGGVSPCMVLFLDDIFTYHPYHPPPPSPPTTTPYPTHTCAHPECPFCAGFQHIWCNFFAL